VEEDSIPDSNLEPLPPMPAGQSEIINMRSDLEEDEAQDLIIALKEEKEFFAQETEKHLQKSEEEEEAQGRKPGMEPYGWFP